MYKINWDISFAKFISSKNGAKSKMKGLLVKSLLAEIGTDEYVEFSEMCLKDSKLMEFRRLCFNTLVADPKTRPDVSNAIIIVACMYNISMQDAKDRIVNEILLRLRIIHETII